MDTVHRAELAIATKVNDGTMTSLLFPISQYKDDNLACSGFFQ
jgi:hypothetical protein